MIRTEEPAKRDTRYIALLDEIDGGRALQAGGALSISRGELQKVRETLAQPHITKRRYRLFLLMRINAAIEGDDTQRTTTDATMEHIFPSRPQANSRWQSDFPEAIAARYRNMLGNLTLLTEAEQNEARNHDFALKRPVLAGSRFELSRRLGDRGAWMPKDVDRATQEMIDILVRSWGLG